MARLSLVPKRKRRFGCAQEGRRQMGAGRHATTVPESGPGFPLGWLLPQERHKARPVRRRYMRQFGSPRRWVAGFEGKSVTVSESLKRYAFELCSTATRLSS